MSEEKNSDSESKEEQPKKERKFNPEHYIKLLRCSEKGPEGIKEWNRWRVENPTEKIWLQKAYLRSAKLQGAKLLRANLEGADLQFANLQDTDLRSANLRGAMLKGAHLEGARLVKAHLEKVYFVEAYLEKVKFHGAFLQGAIFRDAKLHNTIFYKARLQGTTFQTALVNSTTSFWGCKIDNKTDFLGVDLENMRIEYGTKILLKYNIRRKNWEDWYKEHRVREWPVKLFWKMSDYGISTGRIMTIFFALALAFSFIYYLRPCCVMVNGEVGDIQGFVHALYFSVVTMTTLGFGDIAANPDSWQGQVVLMVQVIFGYVLLGALITRLAVLFTSDGPAGSFTKMDKETKKLLAKLDEEGEKEA